MRKSSYAIIILILVSFATSLFFYPHLPKDVASHWDAAGQVNGYMPKFWGTFLLPLLTIVILALFVLLPKIDPLKKNIEKFHEYYEGFIVMIASFMFYLHLLTLFWNIGYKFNMIVYLMPAFSILFYYTGILTGHAKRNWFIGIKTPWTLSSDEVWDKTHKLGGKMFKTTAILTFLGTFLPDYAIILLLLPALATAVVTIVYSYMLYKKKKKRN